MAILLLVGVTKGCYRAVDGPVLMIYAGFDVLIPATLAAYHRKQMKTRHQYAEQC